MNLLNLIKVPATGSLVAIGLSIHAATYSDQDVLLVFRADGYDNIEFDLGNVTQFLNHTNGYRATISNWSPALVNSNFSLTNGLAQFLVLATTSDQDSNPRAWITDAQPLVTVTDVTPSQWEFGLFSPIDATGLGVQNDPNAPLGTNEDVLSPLTRYAFDYIASNGLQNPSLIPYLGGGSGLKFRSAGSIPGTLLFYEIHPSTLSSKPAGTLVGSFTLTGDGRLSFQSGPVLDAARVLSVKSSGGVAVVTFTSRPAVKYRLRFSNQPASPLGGWTILPGSVVGDGNPQTLQDNLAGDIARFYTVESYP